jgi:aspartyl-tRNA(Asn)/glutamyl-tRNA(Gln) amidotransferase subunit C
MPINRKDVERIADLARLELSAEETTLFTDQLSSIIRHIEKLDELDTADVSPMSHCAMSGSDAENARRDDRTREGIGQKLALENAPDPEAGYFRVPRVIEK